MEDAPRTNNERPSRPFLNPHIIGPWRVGRRISFGDWKHVRLAQNVLTGQLAATMIATKPLNAPSPSPSPSLRFSRHSQCDDLLLIDREIVLLKLVQHRHVVRLLDVWESRDELFAFLEYFNSSPLISSLPRAMGFLKAVRYLHQLTSTLNYCHGLRIAHGNINPSSVVVDRKDNLRLMGFGYASWVDDDSSKVACLLDASLDLNYVSPEVLVLLTGSLPYGDIVLDPTKRRVVVPPGIPPVAADLLRCIRITLRGILEHSALALIPAPQRGPSPSVISHSKLKEKLGSEIRTVDPYICENLRSLWPQASLSSIKAAVQEDGNHKERMVYLRLLEYRHWSLQEYNSLQTKFKRIGMVFPPNHIRILPDRDGISQTSSDSGMQKRVSFAPTRLLQSFSHGLLRHAMRSIRQLDVSSGKERSTPSISVIAPDLEQSSSFSSNLNSVSPNYADDDISFQGSFSVSSPSRGYDGMFMSPRPADSCEAMDSIVRRSHHSPLSQFVLKAYDGSSEGSGSGNGPAWYHLCSFASPEVPSRTHPIGLGIVNDAANGAFRTYDAEHSSSRLVGLDSAGTQKENSLPSQPGSVFENGHLRASSSQNRKGKFPSLKDECIQNPSLGRFAPDDSRVVDWHFVSDTDVNITPGRNDCPRRRSRSKRWLSLLTRTTNKNAGYSLLSVQDALTTLIECERLLTQMSVMVERTKSSKALKDIPTLRCTVKRTSTSFHTSIIHNAFHPVTQHLHLTAGYRTRLKLTLLHLVHSESNSAGLGSASGGDDGFATPSSLTTFNQIYSILRRDWTLDIPTDLLKSPSPVGVVRIAASPAIRDAGLELAPWA
ncbi:kinase-like domain-containing protein [Cantharellus anzutake]|uniref:kinase-like domain-containing protein n=1 Tax=Cantharellus anzutake TaxID=1750568 RepID=UPI00190878CD|nr:kinase-like domain-containing protein [Cantharellus anzutake]KAF8325425.1 kinase-like domain-containing protein [Cantharellus anzutake]